MAGKRKRVGKSQDTPEQQQNTPQGGEDSKKEPVSEHTWEGSFLSENHKHGCVNRHVDWYAARNKCSHRGQAKKRALDDEDAYKWPKDALLQPEREGDFDVDKRGNFERRASVPYAHEAHHIVAAAELKNATIEASKGIEPELEVLLMIRSGLMKEGYNVNNRGNMIILPMDLDAMKALGLPLHRKTINHRHHSSYSDYIKKELLQAFAWIKDAAAEHKKVPPYQSCKEAIELLAEDVYPRIKSAGQKMKSGDLEGDSLDDIPHEELAGKSGNVSLFD